MMGIWGSDYYMRVYAWFPNPVSLTLRSFACVTDDEDKGKEKGPASTQGGLVERFKVATDPNGQWVQLSGQRYSIPLLRKHFGCECCWAMTVTKKNGPMAYNVCAFKGQPGHGKLGRLHKFSPEKKKYVMANLSEFEVPGATRPSRSAPSAGSIPEGDPASGSQATGSVSQSVVTGQAAVAKGGRGKGGSSSAPATGKGAGRGSASGN
jgi:hypothetical protein